MACREGALPRFPRPMTASPSEREASSVEQLLLVEEISHRVVNEYTAAIAAIGLEVARTTEPRARAALIRIQAHLRALADAHRALQAPVGPVEADLAEYLDRLCAALSAAMPRPRPIRMVREGDSASLATDDCWRVGLIIAELITNAVRHGSNGDGSAIVVEVRTLGKRLECQVADSAGPSPDPGPSRGRGIVSRLAADLGGSVSWRFEPHGVTATLSIPLSVNGSALSGSPLAGSDWAAADSGHR